MKKINVYPTDTVVLELLIVKQHIDVYKIGNNYTGTRQRKIYVGYINLHKEYTQWKGSRVLENHIKFVLERLKEEEIIPE